MTHNDDDDDDRGSRWLHPGDIGTILLAGVFLVGMLFMVFAPSPFESIFKKQPEAKPSNEVMVTLPDK